MQRKLPSARYQTLRSDIFEGVFDPLPSAVPALRSTFQEQDIRQWLSMKKQAIRAEDASKAAVDSFATLPPELQDTIVQIIARCTSFLRQRMLCQTLQHYHLM